MTHSQTNHYVMAVLALELKPGTRPQNAALPVQAAGKLMQWVARDLAALIPEVQKLELVMAAAHFDPAEILRPGWPLYRRLAELQQRAPQHDNGPRLIVFGSDESGQVPQPIQANPEMTGGALRVLPILLSGDAETIQTVSDRMETILLDRGMAGTDTALFAQKAFGAELEHARYLTHFDLAAIIALQYQHQRLHKLWPIIETALLRPEKEEWLDQPPEPLLRYANGIVRMSLLGSHSWHARHADHLSDDPEKLARAYRYFEARQRQIAAVLEAHGIPVVFAFCDGNEDPRETLSKE
ncbi:MAG: hypothetical protein LBL59_08455 [Xanthomonadaceae bacterium]|jgi:hypothetical protein|nr:hypothetical protein [Xanthomonadaceae bacterium]